MHRFTLHEQLIHGATFSPIARIPQWNHLSDMTALLATRHLPQATPGNRLLLALPDESQERLWPKLEPVELTRRELIYVTGAQIEHVYFIDQGLVSLMKTMSDGRVVEVGAVGTEGVVCLGGALGLRTAILESVVQVPGVARRITIGAFGEATERDKALRGLMRRYTEVALSQLSQSAACNRLHSLEERFCRWLLTAHDNAGTDSFRMTHEFLALMLGVQRPGLSITAHALQEQGLIHYHNGEMSVRNRQGLEATSCECYRSIRRQVDLLLGPVDGGPASNAA